MNFRDEAMILCAMMRELSEWGAGDPLYIVYHTKPYEDKWMHIFRPNWCADEFASRTTFRWGDGKLFITPLQHYLEIAEFLAILSQLRPRTILEIGTCAGGTLFLFTQVAPPDAIIITVDLPNGYPSWRNLLYKAFAKYRTQRLYTVRRDSHDPKTLETVKFLLKGLPVDFLLIDGDHRYESVKKDFEMYSPLVRKGGIIAFHDIASVAPGVLEVRPFWDEIKHEYRYMEIIKEPGVAWGIGVLFL